MAHSMEVHAWNICGEHIRRGYLERFCSDLTTREKGRGSAEKGVQGWLRERATPPQAAMVAIWLRAAWRATADRLPPSRAGPLSFRSSSRLPSVHKGDQRRSLQCPQVPLRNALPN